MPHLLLRLLWHYPKLYQALPEATNPPIFQCALNLILGFMIGYYDKVGVANYLEFVYVAQWLIGTE